MTMNCVITDNFSRPSSRSEASQINAAGREFSLNEIRKH